MKELELRNAYNKCLLDDEDYEKFKNINCNITKDGYVDFYIKNDTIKLHRHIMKVNDRNLIVDHIDGNPLNNQKKNLRICSKLDNTRNRRKYISNTSGYKGVHFQKANSKWEASIQINNKNIHIGYFETSEEAATAYDEASKKYHGKFSSPNCEIKERKPIKILWKPTKFDDPNLKPGMVPLGNDRYAYVDLEDYERVMNYNWHFAQGYANCRINNRTIGLHVFIMNPNNKEIIDHKDRDGLNNKKENLRLCNNTQNLHNSAPCKHSSRYKGVSLNSKKNKWSSSIMHNKKSYWLGIFEDEISAAKKYDENAIKYFGEFAYTNFPKENYNIGEKNA